MARGNASCPGLLPKPPHAPAKAERAGQLDHAMIEVVGDVSVTGGVEGDAVGEAELSRPDALRAGGALIGPVGVELLDAMVVVICDQHLAGVRGDAARVGELARAAALGAPFEDFAALQVEALDAVVARVGDVHVVAGHGDAAARRLGVVLRGAEAELAGFRPLVAPLQDEVAVCVELLDAVVAGVDDVHVTGGVHGQPADRPELAVSAAVGAPLGLKRAGRGELLHDVAELVGDVHVADAVDGDGLGEAQHALGALADDLRGGVRARRRADACARLAERARRARAQARQGQRSAQRRWHGRAPSREGHRR